MHARVLGAALHGIDAHLVQVEVDISRGLPTTRTVGLPEAAAREGNERVRAAIANSGWEFPCRRIVINLAPADVRKRGSSLDLPVSIAIVAASTGLDLARLERFVLYGELGLDGRVRPVPGALAASIAARAAGLTGVIVSPDNAAEAGVIPGVRILAAPTLRDVIVHLKGEADLAEGIGGAAEAGPASPAAPEAGAGRRGGRERRARAAAVVDLADVRGQLQARRALEIAAAGGHNVLMVGPPGSGKTLLARCLPGILPPLGEEEAIEVTRIHGALGTGIRTGLIRERPFRSPHHTVSDVALVGGGAQARPGEVSLAHHGVLFLDEMPEFRRNVIEVLRQPLEEGFVTVARAARTLTYPAAFMLVGAMNPCRCGHLGDPRKDCRCTPLLVARYRARLSGPLLDRIDLHVEVPGVAFKEIHASAPGEPSAPVAARVREARTRQARRYGGGPGAAAGGGEAMFLTNARALVFQVRACAAPDEAGSRYLERAMAALALSARAHDRVLRVARTIADLEASDDVRGPHVAEALRYRCLDRPVGVVTVG